MLLQAVVHAALTAARQHALVGRGSLPQPTNELTHAERFLAAFPSLNPYTAAVLGSSVPVGRLVNLNVDDAHQLAQSLPSIPERSLQLVLQQLTWGQPSADLGRWLTIVSPSFQRILYYKPRDLQK